MVKKNKDYTSVKTYASEAEAKRNRKVIKNATDHLSQNGLDQTYWWTIDPKDDPSELASAVVSQGTTIREAAMPRLRDFLFYTRLYENCNIDSLDIPNLNTFETRYGALSGGALTLNVVSSCIDTIAAKVSKNRPTPTFTTSGQSWLLQQKAKKLDKWAKGFLYEIDIYKHAKKAFIDAQVTGTGFIHLCEGEDGRLMAERVVPGEIYVDVADGIYANPRQMFRRKLIQKEVLVAYFPEHAEAIAEGPTPPVTTPSTIRTGTHHEMVEVWEAWHLPSSEKSGDGRHIIAINGGTVLCDEEWKIDSFPFAVVRATPRTVGYYGRGTADQLKGVQLEINRVISTISEQLRRKQKNVVFMERGSKINPNHLNNSIGTVVEYTGRPPSTNNSNAVAAEDYNWLESMYRWAYQIVGVSELSAGSKKPAGLDAGVALREYSDIESERFALQHQAWDETILDVTKLGINLITKQYGWRGYEIKLKSGREAVCVDWQDVKLDPDSYTMEVFPSSSLPQTPAARKQQAMELLADGFISKTACRRLLQIPDVDSELSLEDAALDDTDWTISQILDEPTPVYHPPEPLQDIALLLERAHKTYLQCRKYDDIEPTRLDMLRNLVDQCTEIIRLQQEELQAQQAAMQAPPQE